MPKSQPLKGIRSSRPPIKPRIGPNELYISKATKFRWLENQAKRMFMVDKRPFIVLHALGARTCNASFLALKLKDTLKFLDLSLTTTISTSKVIDDFEPEDEEEDITSALRQLPAIHIKLSKSLQALNF
ncbi:hypothetical protein DSO57_1007672 [Entomophthora muscae]|uniref:Uncharacterized protein n=1 Tax=Entomophthora muscae TaxID=34485 RepID=A0ACC2T776_9FUNG|nr:hypothetical protein DSO57_1007672 [Entomophthora muscae]